MTDKLSLYDDNLESVINFSLIDYVAASSVKVLYRYADHFVNVDGIEFITHGRWSTICFWNFDVRAIETYNEAFLNCFRAFLVFNV